MSTDSSVYKIMERKIITYSLIVLISFSLLMFSCVEEKNYPVKPHIEYKSFVKTNNDSTGIITLEFTDGDGDIGLSESDTLAPYDSTYFYNFFLYPFKYTNGQYDSVDTSIPYHGRIPKLENVEPGESIEGEIEMEIDIYSMDLFIPADTVAFDIFIVDRALHHSNTIRTLPIILDSF